MPKARTRPPSRRRPHNKSWLWDHYVEHYDSSHKDLIMANSKHKGAFCRACIERAMAEMSDSPQVIDDFKSSNFACSWDEWRYRKAFEKVPKISGRRPNLWKHIDTCPNIPTEAKNHLRIRFRLEEDEIQRLKEMKPHSTPRPAYLPSPAPCGHCTVDRSKAITLPPLNKIRSPDPTYDHGMYSLRADTRSSIERMTPERTPEEDRARTWSPSSSQSHTSETSHDRRPSYRPVITLADILS